MSYQNQNFGMMDEGYFVPRTEILTWINSLLQLNLTKIQQLGSGAVYCQLIDVIHPGKVAMNKINWKAKNDYEFISNLKILLNAFDKIGIKKHIEVERIAKAKYQDNLELIQWMKRYFDINCGERGNNYLPEERRGNIPIDFSFAEKNVVPKTYNGSGATTHVTEKQPVAPRVKTPEIKKKISPPHKITISTQNLASNKKLVKKQEIKQQVGNTKQNQNSQQIIKKYETKILKLENSINANAEVLEIEREKTKQAEIKIQMIRQILKGEDDDALKVSLLEQILNE